MTHSHSTHSVLHRLSDLAEWSRRSTNRSATPFHVGSGLTVVLVHDPDRSGIPFKSLKRTLNNEVDNTGESIVGYMEFKYKSKVISGDDAVNAFDEVRNKFKGDLLNRRHVQQRQQRRIDGGGGGRDDDRETPRILFVGHHFGCDVVASVLCHPSCNDFDITSTTCYFFGRFTLENDDCNQDMPDSRLRHHLLEIRENLDKCPRDRLCLRESREGQTSIERRSSFPLPRRTNSVLDLPKDLREGLVKDIKESLESSKIPPRRDTPSSPRTPLVELWESAGAYYNQGRLREAQESGKRAAEIMKLAGQRDTNLKMMEMKSQLATIQMHLGHYEESRRMFDSLRIAYERGSLPREGGEIVDIAIRNVSELLFLQGKYRDSLINLGDLLQRGKKDATCLRLLALTSAHLGRLIEAEYHIKDAFRVLGSGADVSCPGYRTLRPAPSEATETPNGPFETQRHLLLYAKAVIYRVSGNYGGFLREAQGSLRGLQDSLPATHFRILEAATLEAQALAYASDLGGAEVSCLRALGLIKDNLGVDHPQHLHAMSVMVMVFRLQSRLREAVATGQSLLTAMQNTLGEQHPETLDCQEELAIAYSLSGMYLSALEEIDTVVRISKSQGDERPAIGRYVCTQASVYLAAGKLRLASLTSMLALKYQLDSRHYSVSRRKYPIWDENEGTVLRRILAYLDGDFRSELDGPNDPSIESTIVIHLLDAAEVLARTQLQSRKEGQESVTLFLIQDLFKSTWTLRTRLLGENHHLALQTQFWLAQALDGHPYESLRLLRDVYIRRKEVLGPFHLDTMTTKMEYIKTSCTANRWEYPDAIRDSGYEAFVDDTFSRPGITEDDWETIGVCSQEVAAQQEAALGEDHPETIKSLIWVLTLQLSHGNSGEEAWIKIHKLLGRPEARRQRAIEVSSTENRLETIRLKLGQGLLPEPTGRLNEELPEAETATDKEPEVPGQEQPVVPEQESPGTLDPGKPAEPNLEQEPIKSNQRGHAKQRQETATVKTTHKLSERLRKKPLGSGISSSKRKRDHWSSKFSRP